MTSKPVSHSKVSMARIDSISLDPTTQIREQIHIDTVDGFAETLLSGRRLQPVVLFGTELSSWIGDGWHRVLAVRRNGGQLIAAELRPGSREDALRYGLNAAHTAEGALPLSRQDQVRAVMLASDLLSSHSAAAIAALCDMDVSLVTDLQRQCAAQAMSAPERLAAPALSGAQVADALTAKFNEFPAVTHRPAHCPNCASTASRITGVRHPIPAVTFRYHVCLRCGARYRSTQALPRVDSIVFAEAEEDWD